MGQAAEGERSNDPVLLARLLDASPYLTFLLDSTGQILWVNDAVERLFGFRIDEVVGTNILDYIDVDWDPGALGSIAEALDADGLRLPTVFQVQRKDGSTQIVEAWANSQINDPVLQGLVVCARRWDERILIDRAFESLAAGEALEHTLRLLVQVMASETLDAHGAVLYEPKRDGFDKRVSHPDLHPGLEHPAAGGDRSPWEEARRSGEPFAVHVDDLPEPLRAHADGAGHDMCWVWPVSGEGGGVEACLVAWRTGDVVTPDFTRVRLLESLVRLAQLAFERDRTHARLEHAATHDPLTHLANRTRFYDDLEAAAADPDGGQVAVLYLDLDGFKPINDTLGHGAGDDVLIAVARRLSGAVRDSDLVARLGGDEFAVLCPTVASAAELEALAQRLVDVVAEPVEVRGEQLSVGISVGAAIGTAGHTDGDHLVEAADRMLYAVKNAGKGGYQLETVSDTESLSEPA